MLLFCHISYVSYVPRQLIYDTSHPTASYAYDFSTFVPTAHSIQPSPLDLICLMEQSEWLKATANVY